ncbi:MAG: hypothetical protein KH936_09145, partial [Neisseria sp.]|nr:hypothetical protein [Neisseria sp.]
RPLPELRNGCLPWWDAGGGRAVCCYDTGVPIYKRGLWLRKTKGRLKTNKNKFPLNPLKIYK